MKWTEKKPKTSGWYWWRRASRRRAFPVRVVCFRSKLWVDNGGAGIDQMSDWSGQWAGPIHEPK